MSRPRNSGDASAGGAGVAASPADAGPMRGGPQAPMVAVSGVTRTFGHGTSAVQALRGATLTVARGQLVALRGRSGSGKTTLLNIIGGLDTPDGGRVEVGGRDVTAMSERERLELRRKAVAFIFQSFGLITILSAAENVGIPLRIAGIAAQAAGGAGPAHARHRGPGRPRQAAPG